MTVTLQQLIAAFPTFVAKAEAGEEVLIETQPGKPTVKLAPVAPPFDPLKPHPQLTGSVVILDPVALVNPLPAEEWGGLAD